MKRSLKKCIEEEKDISGCSFHNYSKEYCSANFLKISIRDEMSIC